MTNQGDLVLVECKLWRNPEARRAVIGQILDYAAELATWNYEKLENAVKRAKSPPGVDKSAKLIDRVRRDGGMEEPKFIDAVYRNLRRGRFLLLIVCDGIREGIGSIAAFLEGHAGLHFDFALAELPVIPLPNGMGYIVQPRVVASTERVLRGIVEFRDDRVEIRPPPALGSASRPRVAGTITEERFYELLEQIEHGLGARAQQFFEKIKEFGIEKEPSSGFTFRLKAQAAGKSWDLGSISGENGLFWIDHLMNNEKLANRWPDLIRYYRTLAENLEEPERARALNTVGTKSGTRTLPLAALLKHPNIWLAAMQAYLRTTENAEAK